MNEGRDVTIKAHELDRLLQLALVGARLHRRNARLPAEAVERLQSLDMPQVRERAGLVDPAYRPLSMKPAMTCLPQSRLVMNEEHPCHVDDGEVLTIKQNEEGT